MNITFYALLYSLYQDKYYLYFMAFCSQMVKTIAISLQFALTESRPFPECTPDSYTTYGMPAPEIVSVTNIATSILFYSLVYPLSYSKTELKPKGKFKRVFGYLSKILNGITGMFFIIGYPFLIYAFYLCTLKQAVFSAFLGVLTGIIQCILVIGLLNIMYNEF